MKRYGAANRRVGGARARSGLPSETQTSATIIEPRTGTAPTPAEIGAKASRRAEMLRERIDVLGVELARLRGEMNSAPRGSTARQRYKDRAKQVLRQKKTLERRMEQALNQTFNMAVIEDAVEVRSAAEADAALYASMRSSLGLPVGSESGTDFQESVADIAEIQQLLNEPLDSNIPGFDDETLEAELEEELRAAGLGQHCASTPAVGGPSAEELRVAGVQGFDGPVGPVTDTASENSFRNSRHGTLGGPVDLQGPQSERKGQ